MTLNIVKCTINQIIYLMMASPAAVTLKMTADLRDLVMLRDNIQVVVDAEPPAEWQCHYPMNPRKYR